MRLRPLMLECDRVRLRISWHSWGSSYRRGKEDAMDSWLILNKTMVMISEIAEGNSREGTWRISSSIVPLLLPVGLARTAALIEWSSGFRSFAVFAPLLPGFRSHIWSAAREKSSSTSILKELLYFASHKTFHFKLVLSQFAHIQGSRLSLMTGLKTRSSEGLLSKSADTLWVLRLSNKGDMNRPGSVNLL